VSKIIQNQKSLERIIAYNQSSSTQYKTSRLPLSNQKIMIESNEMGIGATADNGVGATNANTHEVFLSQPQQSKKSQSFY